MNDQELNPFESSHAAPETPTVEHEPYRWARSIVLSVGCTIAGCVAFAIVMAISIVPADEAGLVSAQAIQLAIAAALGVVVAGSLFLICKGEL